MEQISLKIGERLKEIRNTRQLTLDDVAELTGVSKPMLGQIERGQSSPTINVLWKISTGLKIPLSFFCRQQEAEYTLAGLDKEDAITEENGGMRAYPLFPFDPVRNVEVFYIEFDAGVCHESKIGVYVADGENVYLVDSGNDKDAGRKVRQILDKNGWHLVAILNTHSNADHIGGNKYLQGQTGCRVYSSGIEAAFTKYPVLEPSFLYGGYPCKDLRHKFLMAQESDVVDFSDQSFPKEIEVIPLPGHFFDMVGFRMPDNVMFLADCISSRKTLDKYAVSFIYDVGTYLETLDKVEQMEAAMFVPAHADASTDMKQLVRYNRDKLYGVAERILSICGEPMCFECILQGIFKSYGLSMNFEQYVLVGSTVRSYLSWLKDTGKLKAEFQDSMLLWQKA